MSGDGFIAHDAMGREITEEVDWLTAEEALDETGLAFLAELWLLEQAPIPGPRFTAEPLAYFERDCD